MTMVLAITLVLISWWGWRTARAIERVALALLLCYPAECGRDVLWALFRSIAGREEGLEQGRLPMGEEG